MIAQKEDFRKVKRMAIRIGNKILATTASCNKRYSQKCDALTVVNKIRRMTRKAYLAGKM